MTPFLKSVATFLYNNTQGALHEKALVFPNKRACIFFNKYLSEITDTPVFAPKYYTITEYMQEISGVTVADQLTLLFELYEVYIKVTGSQESFDDFLFYCEMLLADFDDIDKYLVNAEGLFRNLTDLKEIEDYYEYLDEIQINAIKQFWEAFTESKPSPEKENFSKLWNVLFRIYTDFHTLLEEKGLASEGSSYRKAINLLENTMVEAPGNEVWFIGFNALNICEKHLFKYLKNQGKAYFFWDFDNYYRDKNFHEANYFLKDLVREFPMPTGFSYQSALTDKEKNIKVIDITTNTGQAKILPEILKDLPPLWIHEPEKTAVALADESLLMPVLNAVPDTIPEVNVSMGYPLRETSIYSLIGILLDLQKNKRIQKNGNEQFYHRDVVRVLQSGILSNLKSDETENLLTEINTFNLVYIDIKRLVFKNSLLNELFIKHIEANNFVSYLIQILKQVPNLIDGVHDQVMLIEGEAAFRVLTRLQRIDDILNQTKIEYSFKSLIRLIGKILQGATVPFSGEPLSGMQVMGILETRTLDFDNLVVLSLNEGVFPKSGHVPSFIPFSLRKAFDLPTVEHQDAIFAYYFYRLLQRAKNITLVYTSSVQDSKSGEPSRFIQQLMYEPAFNIQAQTVGYPINPIDIKPVVVEKTEAIRQTLLDKFSAKDNNLLSPSAINTYLNCQLRFYYRYVAGLKEPENVLEEVEANTLGSILHKVMEKLYENSGKKIIEQEDLQNIIKNKPAIHSAIVEAFWTEYLAPGRDYPGEDAVEIVGKNILVKAVIEKYTHAILKFDLEHTPFEIIGLEDKHIKNFKIDENTEIAIGGYIDRLDRHKGKIRIIDYKTGKTKKGFDNIEELFEGKSSKRNVAAFQTLLYSLVIPHNNETIEPGLFFVRDMQHINYSYQLVMGQRKDKTIITDTKSIQDEFNERLITTLNDMFSQNGSFVQTEDQDYCGYCPYAQLCAK